MLMSKFIPNFLVCFVCLFVLVWLGTGFDDRMTFSWYAYTIEGVLSLFYAWAKSANMNTIEPEKKEQKPHLHHHRPMPPQV